MSGQLKEVRDRMKSVKSTQQITKAMKMVSAAKLRKAQMAITEMRPYADRLNMILKNILSNIEGDAVTSFGVEREVVVCYSQFVNAAVQEAKAVQFLPVEKMEGDANPMTGAKADYIFEPSKEKLLEDLVPSILQTTFQKFVLDTHAGEHGARMTAMDAATDNAEELLKSLKISYNKARQEAITKELSEIVGGAAALGG